LLKKTDKQDSFTFVGPLEESLKRLRDTVEKGQWKERIDYEMLLWGLERVIKDRKDGKKTYH